MERADFYTVPWVATALVRQFYRRYVVTRGGFKMQGQQDMRRHYTDNELEMLRRHRVQLWNPLDAPHFEIHTFNGNTHNPVDLAYFVHNGVIEFIPEVSTVYDLNRTDTVIVDLDPKDPKLFTFDDTRGATQVVLEAITHPSCELAKLGIEQVKLRFSGNRSFHIYLRLKKPYKFEDIREPLKKSLDVATKLYPSWLSYKHLSNKDDSPRTNYILVDIGALSRHRCVRSLWSVHAKTGLVCVPVESITEFDRDAASMDAVLARGPVEEVF